MCGLEGIYIAWTQEMTSRFSNLSVSGLCLTQRHPRGRVGGLVRGPPPPGEGPGPEARVWEMPLEGLIFWESHPLRGAGPGGWRWTLPLPGGLKVKPLVCVGWAYDS